MYKKHVGKKSILLWAYSTVHARGSSTSKKQAGTNFEQHKKTMSEVDEKYDELRKKHGTNYTLEQLRMWEQRFGVDVNANKINILTHPHLNE